MKISMNVLKRAVMVVLLAVIAAASLSGCIVVPYDHDRGWHHDRDWDHDRDYHHD